MIQDRIFDQYVHQLQAEISRIQSGVVENSTLTLEELRRAQGQYVGLVTALDLLKGVLEENDK